jgi:hypothetical protein
MSYKKSQLLYDDGRYYKWTAPDNHENPYYTTGRDYCELNKTEGYEVLYYINHLGYKRWAPEPSLAVFQKMERMLRYHLPLHIRSHKLIEDWIIANWSNV